MSVMSFAVISNILSLSGGKVFTNFFLDLKGMHPTLYLICILLRRGKYFRLGINCILSSNPYFSNL